MRFTISINELIDAAHAAEANSSALFAAVGLLRWHEGNDKIVDLLREKGTRKHEQAERFKTLYEARLASLEGKLANLESGLTAATIALSEDVP